jgi:hypothetical protein
MDGQRFVVQLKEGEQLHHLVADQVMHGPGVPSEAHALALDD